LALALSTCLLAAPAAQAKSLTKIVVVGSKGTTAELTGFRLEDWASSPARVAPKGSFLLVYPVIDQDIVAQPGRYYAEQHALCFSWDRRYAGRCYWAPTRFESNVSQFSLLAKPLPFIKRISVEGKAKNDWSNGAVAIELAFNRASLARVAERPRKCSAVRVRWSAAGRPNRFWACRDAIWAAGKLYPSGRLLF